MTDAIATLEVRRRWVRYRQRLAMTEDTGSDHFASGGLAKRTDGLTYRIVILPLDPESHDRVPLDDDTAEWLANERATPYGGQPVQWGHSTRATSTALARAQWYNDAETWTRYLAIHRHGGIEMGDAGAAWTHRDQRYLSLRSPVAATWVAVEIQNEASRRWEVDGPWEITLAIPHTEGAALGDFSEGWRSPGDIFYESALCREPQILHRWELDNLDAETIALSVGDRIENSFGTTHRRHLARRGEWEGSFDPRNVL